MSLVHWHEGLFLQPHHLQMLQREGIDRAASERRLAWPYPYGVVEARLSPDALENLIVRFDRLRVVTPSGLEIDVPGNTDLPALDIKQAFQRSAENLTIGLAVPLWDALRANTVEPAPAGRGRVDDTRVKRLWRLSETKRPDENTGESTQDVIVRRVNARLVIQGDDTTDMEVIPLLRVVHGTGEQGGQPKRDSRFLPPCMVIGGSADLRALLRDLANQVEASRRDLVFQITRAGFNIENIRGPQFEELMRLRTLNVFAARLPAMVAAGGNTGLGVAPFDMYLELRHLLSELAALYPDRDPWEAPKYDHDDPSVSFYDLDQRIRQLLRGVVKKRFMKTEFVRDAQGVLSAQLTDEHLKDANEYFLGIRSKGDPNVLAKLVEDADKFKLMPKSMWKMVFFGVKLDGERHPPTELPSEVGLHYFRLNKAETRPQIWEQLIQQKAMAARWPENEGSDIGEIQLYMTVG
ncbi:MAG: type VI secretion system baseplate subunit TssK [Planctomycetota bacterium]